jgi:opine dehydrogenase
MVVTPASAHREIAENISPYLTDGQIILLNPGRTFGAVEFIRVIEEKRGKFPIFVGETQTLLFTSRALENNKVDILKIKDSVNFTCFPDKYTDLIYNIIKDVFPQLNPIDDYLEVTLNNIGMLLHPTISLFNAGLMDFGKEFKFYSEGTTPRVCLVLENIEMEINKIFEKLGLKQLRFSKWAEKSYGVKAESIYQAIQQVAVYKDINAPTQLITRYFTEDVPTGLVPISSLGAFLNVQTPTINSIIYLSSLLCGMDFNKIGRTIQNLELYDYFITHLKRVQIRKDEKKGIFSIENILSNYKEFKICSHCGCINYNKNESCRVCHLKDFRQTNENDLNELRKNKKDALIRT